MAVHRRDLSGSVGRYFEREQWDEAADLLTAALVFRPDCHWLWTRLGTCYYERHCYPVAIVLHAKAHRVAPDCPLVLWDYAGSLAAVGRKARAGGLYRKLLSLPVGNPCWEGKRWADRLRRDTAKRLADLERPTR